MSEMSERFLQYVVASCGESTVYLVNGIRLSGIITYTDPECLTLSRDNITQLIFRHAIATVMPSEPFSVNELIDEKTS